MLNAKGKEKKDVFPACVELTVKGEGHAVKPTLKIVCEKCPDVVCTWCYVTAMKGIPTRACDSQATLSEMRNVLSLEESEAGSQIPKGGRIFRKKVQHIGNTPKSKV